MVKSRKTMPISASAEVPAFSGTQPRTCGPTQMPASR
jgi:hypothetical protein